METNQASQKPVKIWRRKNIHLVCKENDIRFRGPLSYRHLRIIGWAFLLIAMLGTVLSIGAKTEIVNLSDTFINILQSAKSLMAPLFLIAAFAQVLVAKNGYYKLIRTYSILVTAIYLLYIFAYLHYGVGFMYAVSGDWGESFNLTNEMFAAANENGALSINIFIDLVLCALVTFFLNYQPKEHFQGNKIYIFRALVAIPILYEIGSIALKIAASAGAIFISPFVIPLLTTKPPVAFIIFIALALFTKNRERHYLKHGKTHQDYKEFLNTNVNRLHFNLFLVGMIVIAVVVDAILLIGISAIKYNAMPADLDPATAEAFTLKVINDTYALGFGACIPMLLIIPIVIFFDYTKTYKNGMVDIAIPAAGIALMVIVLFEGLFQVLKGTLADAIRNGDAEPTPTTEVSMFKNSIMVITESIKQIFRK